MAMKNAVEVVVDGRVYKISGYESQEYLHQIAVYINEKMTECHSTENYRKQSGDQRQLMLSMNLADDYFKAKNQAEKLTVELEKKERELYSVRHDLIDIRQSFGLRQVPLRACGPQSTRERTPYISEAQGLAPGLMRRIRTKRACVRLSSSLICTAAICI